MYKFKNEDMKVPAYVWSKEGSIEDAAIQQIKNASNLPFAFHHVVLCPDAHTGYGAPIGGVMAAKGYIIPFFVGSDIGCGVCAVKTNVNISEIAKEKIKEIMSEIRKEIPVGFSHNKEKQDESLMPEFEVKIKYYPTIQQEYSSALYQLGSLGSGNHFLELQKDTENRLWIMLHSGSRNLGKKVADFYNKVAIKENEKWFSSIPKEYQLAFLPINSNEGLSYLREMQYCIDFALASRKLMMNKIQKILLDKFGEIEFENIINIAHNYARLENHFGENVWVHRKGAISAQAGEIGIIPGSQGTASYIVKGRGNADSFMSSSHGSGRKMGRNQAKKNLNLDEEKKKLDDKGIIHAIRSIDDLDEAPGSYKDIEDVLNSQLDLITPIIKLSPLAVIKG